MPDVKKTDWADQWTAQITDQVLRLLDAGESCRTIMRELDLSFLFVSRIRRQWLAAQPDPRRQPTHPAPRKIEHHPSGPARRCPSCRALITTPFCVLCGIEVA